MTCDRCGGVGTVPAGRVRGFGGESIGTTVRSCPECGGSGQLNDSRWTEADEIGAVTVHETETKKPR